MGNWVADEVRQGGSNGTSSRLLDSARGPTQIVGECLFLFLLSCTAPGLMCGMRQVLFQARVDPAKPARRLTDDEVSALGGLLRHRPVMHRQTPVYNPATRLKLDVSVPWLVSRIGGGRARADAAGVRGGVRGERRQRALPAHVALPSPLGQ